MSKVNVEKLSKTLVKLTISVSAAQFDTALDKAFQKVIPSVKIDGFRQGKAPKSVFVNRYGWESLYQDAIDFALQDTYYEAVKKSGVVAVSDPKIDLDFTKVKKGSGFKYTAEIEIWPDPVLGEYKGLKVKAKSTKVTKKMIDEYIENQLKSKAEIVVKDTEAALGDTVVIDFEGFVDGVAFEGGKGENYPLELGSGSFIPGFEDQLVGVSAGAEVDVNVVFPENYHESLASKAAVFKVKVHEVKGKVNAELTNEVVEEMEIEGVTTVKQYKEHVKALLTEQKEHENENYIMDTLLKKIESNSEIEVPEAVVNDHVERQYQRVVEQAKQYKVPVEVLLQYSGYQSEEAYREAGKVYIKRQIIEEVIIEEIMKKENFKVTKDELNEEYAKLANVLESDSKEEAQKKIKEAQAKYSKEQVEHHLKMVKAVNLIKESAIIA